MDNVDLCLAGRIVQQTNRDMVSKKKKKEALNCIHVIIDGEQLLYQEGNRVSAPS